MTSISIVGNAAKTRSSVALLEIVNEFRAEFGEPPVRHGDFVARCRDELDGEYYETFVVKNLRGPATEAIAMTPDQCKLVAMRESKGVRRRVLAHLNRLEAEAAGPDLGTDEGKLLMIQDLATKQLALLADNKLIAAERDHAIATKAQISDRKTATAMATASAKARENTKLKALMGAAAEQASILAVQDKTGVKTYQWRKLKAYSIAASLPTGKSFNPGLQLEVNTYSADAWMAVYSVDLSELFGEVAA